MKISRCELMGVIYLCLIEVDTRIQWPQLLKTKKNSIGMISNYNGILMQIEGKVF